MPLLSRVIFPVLAIAGVALSSIPAQAQSVTVSLDSPFQTVALPVSGTTVVTFSGTITNTSQFTFTNTGSFTGSPTLQNPFRFLNYDTKYGNLPPVPFGPGASYTGILFAYDITPTTDLGGYTPGAYTINEYLAGNNPPNTPDASATEAFNITVTGPAAVPEASTTVSFGLLLALGFGGLVVAAKKKKATA